MLAVIYLAVSSVPAHLHSSGKHLNSLIWRSGRRWCFLLNNCGINIKKIFEAQNGTLQLSSPKDCGCRVQGTSPGSQVRALSPGSLPPPLLLLNETHGRKCVDRGWSEAAPRQEHAATRCPHSPPHPSLLPLTHSLIKIKYQMKVPRRLRPN